MSLRNPNVFRMGDDAVRIMAHHIEVYGLTPETKKQEAFGYLVYDEVKGVAVLDGARERVFVYAAVERKPRIHIRETAQGIVCRLYGIVDCGSLNDAVAHRNHDIVACLGSGLSQFHEPSILDAEFAGDVQ